MVELGFDLKVERLSEDWVLLRFGTQISEAVTERVRRYYDSLRRHDLVLECVPTYTDIAIRVKGPSLEWKIDAWRLFISELAAPTSVASSRLITVPISFANTDDLTADMQQFADQVGMSSEIIIEQLLEVEFTVAMVGFLPGMPYLLGLPDSLRLSRRESLVTAQPGAFAIGGQQAGFLPNQTLTGWWRLGTTKLSAFDLSRQPHGLFCLGDKVRLLRVD